jgi:peptidyl-prolyl cis-trans isomerase C
MTLLRLFVPRHASWWLMLAMLAGQAVAQTPSAEVQQALSRPFVWVNDVPQSTAHAEVLYRESIAQGTPSGPALRATVRENLIQQSLMIQAAQSEGLDKNPLVQAQMALASQSVLVRVWQQKILADHPITEEALQQEYQDQMAQRGSQEWLIRHILVDQETLAKTLLQRIQKGEDFALIAAEHSLDPDSKPQGGLVGWVSQSQLVPEIVPILRQMQAPQLWAAPVRTARGWHILSLQDLRPLKPLDAQEIRPQLLELQAQKILQQKMSSLRQKATIR